MGETKARKLERLVKALTEQNEHLGKGIEDFDRTVKGLRTQLALTEADQQARSAEYAELEQRHRALQKATVEELEQAREAHRQEKADASEQLAIRIEQLDTARQELDQARRATLELAKDNEALRGDLKQTNKFFRDQADRAHRAERRLAAALRVVRTQRQAAAALGAHDVLEQGEESVVEEVLS